MDQSLKRTHYEYATVSAILSIVSCVATRLILGDSGIDFSSVGLLVVSALFFWRGYNEPN
jgi:hypothetical protein